jgi:hypothetical protein
VENTTGSAIFKSGRAAKSSPVLQHIRGTSGLFKDIVDLSK